MDEDRRKRGEGYPPIFADALANIHFFRPRHPEAHFLFQKIFGPFWTQFGSFWFSWGHLGGVLGVLGASLASLWRVFGESCGLLEAS